MHKFEQYGTLSINCNDKRDQKFFKRAYRLEFPVFKRLYLYQINVLPNTKYLDHFLCNSLNYTLRYLYISGGSWVELGDYFYPLIKVLPIVTEEVFLSCFKLDDLTLATIMEKSRKCERLGLVNLCMDITDGFYLNDKLDYDIKTLYLDETCVQRDKKSLNQEKIRYFFKAIGKTSMAKSLRKITILSGDFKEQMLRRILRETGIEAEVRIHIDCREPTGYNRGESM